MKKLTTRAIALLLCAVLLCPAVYAAETASAIELTKTTGTVTVSKSNGKALTLRDGMRLYNGYNVTTGADSYAWISLDSTKLLKMDASSSVEVRKNGSKLEVNVKSGTVSFDVSEKLSSGESLNISTSTMSVGIRGTCGWARVTDQWESEICLLEGTSICVVADPVSGQMKSAVLHGGDVARCVVYPKERPGDKCDILMERQSTGGIPGFLLVELVRNIPLCDRILDDSGIDVLADLAKEAGGDPSGRTPDGNSATPEVLGLAERILKRDEAETAQKLEEIRRKADSQEHNISKDPVWKQDEPGSGGGGSGGGGSGPTTYTVTFAYDSKTQTAQTTDAAGKLSALPEPGDNFDGNGDFNGWYTAADGGTQVTADDVFSSNQTVYAQWDANWIFDTATGHLTIFNNAGMNARGATWGVYQNDIQTVDIRPGVTRIADSAFESCGILTEVSIPDTVSSIGDLAFRFCSSLKSVNIPEGVTSIPMNAFLGCSNLTSVSIPSTVKDIETGAFSGCTSLESVNIPESVRGISSGAFSGCTSLASVTIPNSVTAIMQQAFCECSSLTSVTIPEGVTYISGEMFLNCTSLTEVTIQKGVTRIGRSPFSGCADLTDIYFGGKRAEWNAITKDTDAIPDGVTIHCTDGDIPVKITFDPNGGTLTGPATATTKLDCKLSSLPTPTREDYTFEGWYTEDGKNVTTDTVFTADTTVKALWSGEVGPFIVTGGTKGIDYLYEGNAGIGGMKLTIMTATPLSIKNVDTNTATDKHIEVADGASANLTLAGVNIDVSSYFPAFMLYGDSGNVTITLAEGTTNILDGCNNHPGLQKNDTSRALTICCGNKSEGHVCGEGCGKLIATGYEYAAGIGSMQHYSVSNITINGGIITAKSSIGAGIGGGNSGNASNIVINGGVITATGGSGAGIGGGSGGNGTEITINGGTVTAAGGGGGAGIGGGEYRDGRNITITGGTVTATGSSGAAGIGGGRSNTSSQGIGANITITGGTVTATGGTEKDNSGNPYGGGAGIGGGRRGAASDITISGTAQVTATGGVDAPGIGSGGFTSTTATNITIDLTGATIQGENSKLVVPMPEGYEAAEETVDGNTYWYLKRKD